MPDTALDDLAALSPIPGAALAYFVSSGTDYQGTVTNLFVGRTLSATVALGIRSSGASFDLQIASSEAISANRTLSIVLGNADRTLTIGASASVSGTNTGDQTTVSGNAGTATALQTARNINGVAFDGTGNITVTAAAGTLSGATLAAGVTASSLTSFGSSIALGTPGSGTLTNCTGLPPTTGIVGWPANASGVLTNNGSGTLSWAAGGGGTPGGSNTHVQFNDSSSFGGDAQFTFNKTSGLITVTSDAADGATLASFLPNSGASFVKINNNGTVIIDADSSTGTNPLDIKYNGTRLWNFNFSGSLNTNAANLSLSDNLVSVGGGVVHLTTASSQGQIKLYNGLQILPGNLGGSTALNVKIAGSAVRGTTEGTNHLDIFNGTAPAGTLTNGASLYCESGEMKVMDAAGNPTTLSSHRKKDNTWIHDTTVGWKNGRPAKRLIVDMEKLVKFVNAHFGLDFVHEEDLIDA
jgi:hypothetical protein